MPPPSVNRLPREIQNALALIESTIMAVDRLKFWIDHPEPHMPAELLKFQVDPLKLRNSKNKYHPVRQSKFDLHQPTTELLSEYVAAIRTRYRVALCEVELNMDWITGTAKEAMQLQDFALAHVQVPHLRDPVTVFKTTAYFGPRADGNSNKLPHNFVVYADKPSKRVNRPCCHLEWRFCGPAALGNIGLFSLEDCINFDHRRFWSERLRLFSLPSKAEIARWLAPEKADVSPAALTKRANRFMDQYRLDGAFNLQNCRVANPDIQKILKPVDNVLFIPK